MTKIACIVSSTMVGVALYSDIKDKLQEKDVECEFNRETLWIINKTDNWWLFISPIDSPMTINNTPFRFDYICDNSLDDSILGTNFGRYAYVRENAKHIKGSLERRNPSMINVSLDGLKELIGVV